MTQQQFVKYTAQCVHVRRRAGRLAHGSFGRQIGAGADDLALQCQPGRGLVREVGDPEVADFHRAVGGQQEISRLHVPVHDPLSVCRGQGVSNLPTDPGDPRGQQRPTRGEFLGEVATVQKLRHQVVAFQVGAGVIHSDHVRVAELRRGPGLQMEPGDRRLVGSLVQEKLDRHRATQYFVHPRHTSPIPPRPSLVTIRYRPATNTEHTPF